MLYSQMSKEQLQAEKTALEKQYADYKAKGLKLDMSRGKPAPEQLNLSLDMLLHCLDGDYKSSNGIDCRNYGVLTVSLRLRLCSRKCSAFPLTRSS